METVQQNGRFTLFSSKYPSNIYSILFVFRCKGGVVYGGKVQVVALPPRRIDRTGYKLYKDRVSFNIIILGIGQFLFISTILHHALHPDTYLFPLYSTMHCIQKLIYFHYAPPCIAFRNLFISTRLHHALHSETYLFPLYSTMHCILKLFYFHYTPPSIAFRNLFISTILHHALDPETYLFPLYSTMHCIQKLIYFH